MIFSPDYICWLLQGR